MTDSTADKLAAWELIEDRGLIIVPEGTRGWWVCHSGHQRGTGISRLAAVRAWAEAAGVPWPSVNVVPCLAVIGNGTCVAYEKASLAKVFASKCVTVVPCEVVIGTETEGV